MRSAKCYDGFLDSCPSIDDRVQMAFECSNFGGIGAGEWLKLALKRARVPLAE